MAIYNKIAAVVVLYHPEVSVLENLGAILDQVAVLYVVDNSDTAAHDVCRQLAGYANVCIIHSSGNIGIAAAMNLAADRAVEDGYSYILTLDQDSRPLAGMIEALLICHGSDVGIVAPYLLNGLPQAQSSRTRCRSVLTAMTSGSLLNLVAYKKAGPFRADYFIDFVDIEYCLRLHKVGYAVLRAENALLEHHVGTSIHLGWRLSVTTHSPVRKYYKMRNRLNVWREYGTLFPGYIWWDRFRFVLELARLFLFEPDKIEKIKMMWRGWLDFNKGRFGVYAD